ncbi:MAG: alpha/beta fold hydrolase [Cyanobacteria bacterium]|nr:alpha/beta fold hydrolase [Cyanobacteriota bacterium]MDA1020730.1 alpha/beta fold hydrolase [Cyanobacteriota bacterium]
MVEIISKYQVPHSIFKNAFVNTSFARLFRPVKEVHYQREKLPTPDGDFIDLDWSCVNSGSLVVLCHGFESSSKRIYVQSVVNALNAANYDVVVFNYRGCSGDLSKTYLIEVGQQEDMDVVIDKIIGEANYQKIHLVGYSTGGNVVLRYLGLGANAVSDRLASAYVVSPTLDLTTTIAELHEPKNRAYLFGFLIMLCKRLWQFRYNLPYDLDIFDLFKVRSFPDFFERFQKQYEKKTFAEYLEWNSSYKLIKDIAIPTAILLAKDDPFVDYDSYPFEAATENDNITLELSDYGGHVGFVDFDDGLFYSESRMLEYLAA